MSAPQKVNVLLVDDQPSKLLSYEIILRELGETLITSGSARDALGILLKVDVALILVDVCMPDLDGFELAAIIRDHPRYRKIPIIFVSAIQITDLDRLRGYEAGAVDYVPVPVVPEVLRAKVRVFAELHRKTRELQRVNEDLEARVRARTSELEASSHELRRLNQVLEQRIDERTRERESALAQLFEAQKMETVGQLTGGIAHDFNNLLMAVMGCLELIEKRLPDDPRTSRLLGTALQGVERGAALTQRLLAFSRRQDLKPEAVDVARLIKDMEDLLARAIGPGIQLHTEVTKDLPFARVDGNQLELALLNVAVNARDAMPVGGSLTISVEERRIEGSCATNKLPSGSYLCLSVADTGLGMDEATLAKASEPFFTTKGVGKGTGLGLSMVHGLAAQSGGALFLRSGLGQGTTVDIWLPQTVAKPAPGKLAREFIAPPHDDLPKCVVLFVDDDPLVRAGTSAMMEDLGHIVREAPSASDALSMMDSLPLPDLVITDYAMPGMTGLTLATLLKDRFPDLPVIIATGYAELPETEAAEGFLRLSKPFKQSDLSAAMLRVLPRNSSSNVIALNRLAGA